MKSFIQDLFGHQEWADAELWKAVEACPGALDQEDISKRFRHFHSTQYAYHLLLRGEKADVRSFISRYGDSVPIQTVKPNSTRLREVGGTPPTIDFVLWIWKGRPKAEWSSGNDQSIDVREQI
jgi:hypothetical protein